MKKETGLGLGLKLLGLFFAIGPLVIAMGMHNWDIQKAVFDQESLDEVMGQVSSALGGGEIGSINPTPTDLQIDNVTNEVRLGLPFPSLPFSVTMTDLTFSSTIGGASLDLSMEAENVLLVPGENTTVYLVGTLSGTPADTSFSLGDGNMTFEKLGVTITVAIQQSGGQSP